MSPFTLACDHCGGAAITSPNGLFNGRSSDRCESCGYPGVVVVEESGDTVYSATWVSGTEPGDVCDACVCSECDAIREWPRR